LALGLLSFYWLGQVMAGYGGLGAGGNLVLLLLAAFLALHQGIWAWLMAPLAWRSSRPWLLALLGAGLWVGLDHLKNWAFTGFNWSPLAVGLAREPRLMGAADLIGLYGLGLPLAAISGWLAFFNPKKPKSLALVGLALGTLGLMWLYGQSSLARWTEIARQGPEKKIVILQASVEQERKWDVAYRDLILARYQILTERANATQPWLVIWPETAAPFSYGLDEAETTWLNQLLAQNPQPALVGVTRLELGSDQPRLHNRAWLMRESGPGPYYDKQHLVPFGEYVPLAEELPFLKWPFFQGVLGAAGTYSPGRPQAPIVHDGVQLGVMICFESIFPYMARETVLNGAQLLVVTTNDAWFGDSWAPEQHLYQAAWRAVENRRPLIRAANNGISAQILPSGRILDRTGHNEVGAYIYLVSLLPEDSRGLTLFTRFGHYLSPLLALLASALTLVRLSRSPKIRKKISSWVKPSKTNVFKAN
jgi:apolipoprotein N-acyltransferase